jgi:O-methyltransferase
LDKRQYFTVFMQGLGIYRKYHDATMIRRKEYAENLAVAAGVSRNLPGAVVECGTWRGGMAAGLVEVLGKQRQYYFFDSFEGLPPAKEIDGAAAIAYQANVTDENYRDNCRASLDEFRTVISRTGLPSSNCHIFKGFYEHVFPTLDVSSIGPIAVLRLDADWYDSTMICLNTFWGSLQPGGVLLIDDYHTWDGCTRAVNEFFSKKDDPIQRISQGPVGRICYVVKRAPR